MTQEVDELVADSYLLESFYYGKFYFTFLSLILSLKTCTLYRVDTALNTSHPLHPVTLYE